MKDTPIGIAMLNDEREHVWRENNPENERVVRQWTDIIKAKVENVDGSAPQVVAASRIITGTRLAQQMGEELRRAGCRSVIMCYNVWNFPFLVWPFLNTLGRNVPVLSLSNNNGKFPGNVGLLATDGALRQAGIRTHRITGDMDDAKVQEQLADWVRAAQAVTTIRNEVYGLYGGHSMGMETGYWHLTPMLKSLGVTARQIDQLWLVKVMENEVDEADVEKAFAWLSGMLGDRILYDGKMLTPETLKTQLRLYCAMQLVNEDKGFDFCGLKGQREMTEHVCLGDVPEMMMNDPYDWNGPKESVVCATEADSNAAVTMQLLKYLTGGLPALFMDVRLYHPDRDLWDWCNSGNHASWYAAQSFEAGENYEKITLHPALEFYFKAGGASVEFDALPGPMTFCRLGIWDEKPYMVIVRGESADLPRETTRELAAQTDPTWPHVWAKLECTFQEFLSVFPCNHVQGTPGDQVDALTVLCEIAGIKPVILGEAANERPQPIWELVD
ncbi:MAG: L-fucose/L-arabinose isomerase family protein [Candidatus Brocadiae bacterium]|nr:L-fucose/L-arabinose isomerase family protein [Candidatus Brocadiia bacterium]